MKIKFLTLCIFLIASMQISGIYAQPVVHQIAGSSVVKIETTISGPDRNGNIEKGNGTGWCYHDALHVVTALHVVAGIRDGNISVFNEISRKHSNARVVGMLKEADLALLKLDTDIGIKPLTLAKVDPNSTSEFWVYGYPHGVPNMSGDPVRFSLTHVSKPILNNILQNESVKKQLERQKYPLLSAEVLRVGSNVQPGHSGAPVFNSSGNVVGIVDGGLRGGTARLNWAFPASVYVPRLMNSNERPFPTQRSLQATLFSSTIIVQEALSKEEQYKMIETEISNNTIKSDNLSVSKIYTLSYDEILATMDEEDQYDLNDIAREFELNMSNTRYDVYEDFKTGATITIPAGEEMVYEDGLFVTTNASHTLQYFASVIDAESFENALEISDYMLEEILNLGFVEHPDMWYEDDEDPDDFEMDEYDEYASWYVTRYAGDPDDPDKMLIYNAEIDQSELLIVFLVVDLNQMDDPDYLRQFLQFSIALNLADFAGY